MSRFRLVALGLIVALILLNIFSPALAATLPISGTLAVGGPQYNRVNFSNCLPISPADASQNPNYYNSHMFHVDLSGSYTLETLSANLAPGFTQDTTLFLYSPSFDPSNPALNCLRGEDGPELDSMVTTLTANTTYVLVVTTYTANAAGTYTGQITGPGNIILGSAASAPAFTSGAPANGVVGTAYSHTFTASGSPAPTFSVTAGTLPGGLSLTGAVLSGTPTTAGTFNFTVTATNGINPDATQNVSLTVNQAPTFTSGAPANGVVGTLYSHTFTASGAPAPTFSVTAGTLPGGLSLTGAVLSGTPTTAGTFNFTVTATNGINPDATQNVSLTVNQAPAFSSGAPVNGVVGTLYSHTFTASGSPAPTFSVTAGTLPGGLSLTGAVLSGTPTTAGTFNFTVTATNGINPDATQNVSLTVNQAPAFSSGAPVNGVVGTLYSHTFTASGSPAPTFSVTAGTLPGGLSLTGAVLSGTPTTAGTFNFTVTATNGINPDATQNVNLTVNQAPAFSSGAPANGVVGTLYSHTFTASGNPAPTFSLNSGTLPPGLTLNASGLLDGTPTTAGTFNFVVTAINGIAPNATQNVSLTVNQPPAFTSGAPANGVIGTAYSHTFTASGSPAPTFSVTAGTLPGGLSLTGAVLSGTPTAAGTFNFTVTATNGINPDATQNVSLTVNQPPAFTSGAPANGVVGTAYSHTFTASGSPAPTFSVTAGALPGGLSLTGAVLSGIATTAGTFNFTVTATNGVVPDATQNISLTVTQSPAFTSGAPASGVVGTAYSHTFTASGSPAPTFSVTAGALPGGLSLTGAVLSGTPTAAGTFNFTVTASNGTAPDATQNVSIVVTQSPAFTSGAPASGVVGTAYTHTFNASGDPAPTFSVTAGTLPGGLTLNASGLLDGTPTAAGTFNFTVTAANGVAPDATQNVSLTIDPGPSAPAFTSGAPADGTVGVAYSHTFTASGNPAPTFSLTAGTLPAGLTLTGAVLSGTPTTAETATFTVTATNGIAPDATQNVTLTINPAGTTTPATVTQLAGPPPASACTDTNFEDGGVIRSHFTNDADRGGLNCRLIAAGGQYLTWLGGPITFAENIGNQTVLDLKVVAAVDVFKPAGNSGFVGDVVICLKGSGYMIYLDPSESPRVPRLWSTWTTDAFPGYTCTTLYAPGTVVLVANKP